MPAIALIFTKKGFYRKDGCRIHLSEIPKIIDLDDIPALDYFSRWDIREASFKTASTTMKLAVFLIVDDKKSTY